jgi:hypothetical protein
MYTMDKLCSYNLRLYEIWKACKKSDNRKPNALDTSANFPHAS